MLKVILMSPLSSGPTSNCLKAKINCDIGCQRVKMSSSSTSMFHQDLILESMLFRVSFQLRSSKLSAPKSEDHSKHQSSPMSISCHFRNTTSPLSMDAINTIRKEMLESMALFILILRIRSLVHMDAKPNGKLKKEQSSIILQRVSLLLKAS